MCLLADQLVTVVSQWLTSLPGDKVTIGSISTRGEFLTVDLGFQENFNRKTRWGRNVDHISHFES